jgi:hypothetical protein
MITTIRFNRPTEPRTALSGYAVSVAHSGFVELAQSLRTTATQLTPFCVGRVIGVPTRIKRVKRVAIVIA